MHVIMKPAKAGFSVLPSKRTGQPLDRQKQAYKAAVESGRDISRLKYILTLAPAERLRRHDAVLAFVLAARKAGIGYYGLGPRSPEMNSRKDRQNAIELEAIRERLHGVGKK